MRDDSTHLSCNRDLLRKLSPVPALAVHPACGRVRAEQTLGMGGQELSEPSVSCMLSVASLLL